MFRLKSGSLTAIFVDRPACWREWFHHGELVLKFRAFLALARPGQQVKNVFLWLPLFFGYRLGDVHAVARVLAAFAVFSLASAAVYALNDVCDAKDDRRHPKKCCRPIAAGILSGREALFLSATATAAAVVLSLLVLKPLLLLILAVYLILNLFYSAILKRYALIDVTCVAMGFVLRVLAGGIAAVVPVSHWLIIMTFLLALFLALGKRWDDLQLVSEGHKGRKSLDGYTPEFVSHGMVVMAAVLIVSYILYTVSPEVTAKHGPGLYMTALWVILGILRYMQAVFVERAGGSPTTVLLRDRFLQAVLLLWTINLYVALYVVGR